MTMRWWNDIWLNEGFATYMSILGVEQLHPEWNTLEEQSLTNTMEVFELDALIASHPVLVQVDDPSQMKSYFDGISYKKGSSIIRMMHMFLGDDVFFGGVRNYLQKYKYKNAEQDNLWMSLTAEAHKHDALDNALTVKLIMDTWTTQTGYPIVTVTRNYNNNSAKIVQRRFLSDPSQPDSVGSENPCWWVPLSFTTGEELDFETTEPDTWLKCDENGVAVIKELNNLPEPDEWVLFNVQLSGLYKVNYDAHNWNMLIAQLTTDYEQIATLNRAELIIDAMDFAWSGHQDYAIALPLIKYLEQEKEYLPWAAALTKLSDVCRMLRRTPQNGAFKVSNNVSARFNGKIQVFQCCYSCRTIFNESLCQFIRNWAVWMRNFRKAFHSILSNRKFSFHRGLVVLTLATVKKRQKRNSKNGCEQRTRRNSIRQYRLSHVLFKFKSMAY